MRLLSDVRRVISLGDGTGGTGGGATPPSSNCGIVNELSPPTVDAIAPVAAVPLSPSDDVVSDADDILITI